MKKFILLILFIVAPLQAQQDDSKEEKNHFISASASGFSGYGLSYKYSGVNDFVFKGTFLGFSRRYESDYNDGSFNDDQWYNIGAEAQYNLNRSEIVRLYLLMGLRFENSENVSSYSEQYESLISVGSGLGLEINFISNFFVNLDIGFIYFDETREDINQFGEDFDSMETGYTYAIGFGLSYNF